MYQCYREPLGQFYLPPLPFVYKHDKIIHADKINYINYFDTDFSSFCITKHILHTWSNFEAI